VVAATVGCIGGPSVQVDGAAGGAHSTDVFVERADSVEEDGDGDPGVEITGRDRDWAPRCPDDLFEQ
jgi:hypothetical protein